MEATKWRRRTITEEGEEEDATGGPMV